MKTKYVLSGLFLVSALHATAALAGPGVQVGSGQGPEGSATPIDISVDYEADPGGVVVGGQFQITYDSANLTPNITNGCTSANWTCSIQSPGVLQYVSNIVTAGLPTETIGAVAFDISAAAVAAYPLTVANEAYGDIGEGDIPADGTVNGQIIIQGAAYASSPAPGETITVEGLQGGANPAQDVSITNTGAPATTLSVTCTESSDPDNVFTIAPLTQIDIAQGATSAVNVSCDAGAAIGSYAGEMSCAHNGDATGSASPAVYTLACNLLDAPPAVFSSNPAAGSTTDMTAGLDVVAGGTVPDSGLSFTNTAAAGSKNLNVACTPSGSTEISAAPVPGGSIAPGASMSSVISCDATSAGNFSTTYACIYTTDGTTPAVDNGTTADYTYTCDVRGPEATVTPTPADGTTLTGLADPGGTADFMVVFAETGGEGVGGSLSTCSLATGTSFAITSPTFPDVPIPADGSVTVTVTGTDPGGADSLTDTLSCTYTDGDAASTTVSYPLVMDIGGNGTFLVEKVFDDGRPASVDVTLTCNAGLPLTQSFTISEGNPVNFVVTSFESGTMDCTVTEDSSSGYTAAYVAGGDSGTDPQGEGCTFVAIAGGDNNTCTITNTPDPVSVTIDKVWDFTGAEQGGVSTSYELTLYCDSEIIDGTPDVNGGTSSPANGISWSKMFSGDGSATFTAMVVPNYPSSSCWVDENIVDDAIEVINGCMNISVSVGNPAECTITNTVFFEGIPTLNQYGLAIMALLMLGIGMVGFRRFT